MLIICWSFDDHILIIWTETNKETNKGNWLSDDKLLNFLWSAYIWWFGDNLLIIWWSSVNYLKKTNKQTKVFEYLISNRWLSNDCWLYDNLMIIYLKIWWSCDDNILIMGDNLLLICWLSKLKQTNKQRCLTIWWWIVYYLRIWQYFGLCFVDYLLIIWTKKQINKQTKVIQRFKGWSFDDHLLIIW